MSVRVVSLIYFYLVSVIAIILMIIGIYNSVSFVVNSTQFDKYPLRYGGVERCDFPEPVAVDIKTESSASMSAEETKSRRESCIENLEQERKMHKVDDIKNAIAFTLIGVILFGIHFPVALRKSNEK